MTSCTCSTLPDQYDKDGDYIMHDLSTYCIMYHFNNKSTHQININTASIFDMMNLPMIGMDVVRKIDCFRRNGGVFKNTSELKVFIGDGKKLKNLIDNNLICV